MSNPLLDHRMMDFRNFLWLAWKHLNLPDPTRVQYDIAGFLQHGPKRSIIEAFRGVGKSWVTSAFVCWLLLVNPQLNILVVSASKVRADDFTTFTMRLIKEMPILQHLAPREGQRDSKIAFDVGPARASHAPSVKSVGISGQIAGSRADVIVADDIEVPNNSMTQGMREKLSEAVKEFDAVLKPGGRILYLGTPQTEDSLYNILPERGYEVRIWPARFPTAKQVEGYGGKLAPYILTLGGDPGRSTDPQRFSDIDLMERETSYGRSGFALQFMLDTNPSDADKHPLRLSDLVVTNIDRDIAPAKLVWGRGPQQVIENVPNVGFNGDRYHRPMWVSEDMFDYGGTVMTIDPSGRGEDETGYAVMSHLNGLLYLHDAGGVIGGYDDKALGELARLAKEFKAKEIVIESNFGDGMFTKLFQAVLQKIYPCTVTEVRHNTMKEQRIIDTLEPVMNQHRLIVDEKLIEKDTETASKPHYSLFWQMSRIVRQKGALAHDDRLEAVAMAVTYWVEAMAIEIDDAVAEQKKEWLHQQLTDFLDDTNGSHAYEAPDRADGHYRMWER